MCLLGECWSLLLVLWIIGNFRWRLFREPNATDRHRKTLPGGNILYDTDMPAGVSVVAPISPPRKQNTTAKIVTARAFRIPTPFIDSGCHFIALLPHRGGMGCGFLAVTSAPKNHVFIMATVVNRIQRGLLRLIAMRLV